MNKEILLLSDIHGDFEWLEKFLKQHSHQKVIQLGDLGLGFPKLSYGNKSSLNDIHCPNLEFIRGNHDNPIVCKDDPRYLGDYGITDDDIFFVGGGYSIDKEFRTPGVNWWEDEELSIEEFNNVLEVYETIKPPIVITHSQPKELIKEIFHDNYPNRTQSYLSEMLRIHQPSLWISAHLHMNYKTVINGTKFIVINTKEYYTLNI